MKKLYTLLSLLIYSSMLLASVDVPYVFIPNKGQLNYTSGKLANDVLYYNNFNEVNVLFKKDRISYILEKKDFEKQERYYALIDTNRELAKEFEENDSTYYYRVDLVFEKSNPDVELMSEGSQGFPFRYYLGQCPDGIEVNTSSQIVYKNLYPGVDVKFYGKYGGLKYDIIVNSGAETKDLAFRYEGADEIKLTEDKLQVKTPIFNWEEHIPYSYVENEEGKFSKNVKYSVSGNIVKFNLSERNVDEKLVIDPAMTWGTYFNFQQHSSYYNDADAWDDRIVYLTGANNQTVPDLTAGSGAYLQTSTAGNSDFVLLMFNTDGVLLWATYYGGDSYEYLKGGVRFDSQGRIYFSGVSRSSNMPLQTMSGAHNGTRSGYYEDIFLARFDKNGVRQWATFIDTDYYADRCPIDVGPNDNLYMAGSFSLTYQFGSGFTTRNPGGGAYYQSTRTLTSPSGTSTQFNDESFIIQFNTSGAKVWASYFGSDGQEEFQKITVTPNGSIFLVGLAERRYSLNSALPKLKSAGQYYNGTHVSGSKLYLVKFNPNRSWAWATYYGNSSGYSQSYKINILSDSQNNVYIVDGTTDNSLSTQTLSGAYNQSGGVGSSGTKLYILKFAHTTQRLWATYFSGAQTNGYWRPGAYIGPDDELYVVAGTQNTDHPTQSLSGSYNQSSSAGGKDGILARFSSSGALEWSTYVGGVYFDEEVNCVVATEASGGCSGKQVFIFGRTGEGATTGSSSWPVVDPGGGAYVEGYGGSSYYMVAIAGFSESGGGGGGGTPGIWGWTGAVDSDWFEPCNWDKASVPTSTSPVEIPGGTSNQPEIKNGQADCLNIEINSTNGGHLYIYTNQSGALEIHQ